MKLTAETVILVIIGQSGRNFNIGFGQQVRSCNLWEIDSKVAIHILENNHTCDIWDLKKFGIPLTKDGWMALKFALAFQRVCRSQTSSWTYLLLLN